MRNANNNITEKQKVINRIVKHGANPRNAKIWVDEHYSYASKHYKGVAKIAEVIMYL
tara:strand:+ start:226 stop:396 length:171 start_codon:yes stop_codon:yes gene_type:complete